MSECTQCNCHQCLMWRVCVDHLIKQSGKVGSRGETTDKRGKVTWRKFIDGNHAGHFNDEEFVFQGRVICDDPQRDIAPDIVEQVANMDMTKYNVVSAGMHESFRHYGMYITESAQAYSTKWHIQHRETGDFINYCESIDELKAFLRGLDSAACYL